MATLILFKRIFYIGCAPIPSAPHRYIKLAINTVARPR